MWRRRAAIPAIRRRTCVPARGRPPERRSASPRPPRLAPETAASARTTSCSPTSSSRRPESRGVRTAPRTRASPSNAPARQIAPWTAPTAERRRESRTPRPRSRRSPCVCAREADPSPAKERERDRARLFVPARASLSALARSPRDVRGVIVLEILGNRREVERPRRGVLRRLRGVTRATIRSSAIATATIATNVTITITTIITTTNAARVSSSVVGVALIATPPTSFSNGVSSAGAGNDARVARRRCLVASRPAPRPR